MSILLYGGKQDDAPSLEAAAAYRGQPEKVERFTLTITNVFVDDLLDLAGGDEHVHALVKMGDRALAARGEKQTARTRYTYYSAEPVASEPVPVAAGQSILDLGARIAQVRDESAFLKQLRKGVSTVEELLTKADELGIRELVEKVTGTNPGKTLEDILGLIFKAIPYGDVIAKVLLVATPWMIETIYKDDVRLDLPFAFDLTGRSATLPRFRTGTYVAAYWDANLNVRDYDDLELHPNLWGLVDGRLVGPSPKSRTDYLTFRIDAV